MKFIKTEYCALLNVSNVLEIYPRRRPLKTTVDSVTGQEIKENYISEVVAVVQKSDYNRNEEILVGQYKHYDCATNTMRCIEDFIANDSCRLLDLTDEKQTKHTISDPFMITESGLKSIGIAAVGGSAHMTRS